MRYGTTVMYFKKNKLGLTAKVRLVLADRRSDSGYIGEFYISEQLDSKQAEGHDVDDIVLAN